MGYQQDLSQPLLAFPDSVTIPITVTTTEAENHNRDGNIKFISSSSSTTDIIFRLCFLILIGLISLWANHEASKGFTITIVNDAKDSLSGQRFALFYISNGKAIRILQNTSAFVEDFLYADGNNNLNKKKKQVHHVILRLTSDNLTHTAVSKNHDQFIITMNPSIIMEEVDVNYAIISSFQRTMARIWLSDAKPMAPPSLIDGLVEYVSMRAGFGHVNDFGGDRLPGISHFCWEDRDSKVVAHFLDYCERHSKGFIRRLNHAMRDRWENRTVDDFLGIEAKYLCDSYRKLHDFQLSFE